MSEECSQELVIIETKEESVKQTTVRRTSIYEQATEKINEQEFSQRVNMILTVLMELYRAITSSLLILFVPQDCGNGIVCTLSDNMVWEKQELYNVALIFNFISLASFLSVYIVEVIRENRLIKYLDVNVELPNDDEDVAKMLQLIPSVKKQKILAIDKYYQICSYISMVIYAINIILSGQIVNKYYLNNQTVSTFITYVLFMFTKLSSVYTITNTKEHTFYSAYLRTNVQYNDADRRYKH
jgi:hypothetical protein